MRYLSLFSGIEAASVAWLPLGWTCVGVAEIDPFPCAVLAHHYPDVPNLGSVVDITDAQIAALGPIDIVVGGSPCQDLSVAGTRAGLAGERSGLFHQQLRIFHAARHFCGARFLLWENVPGAFSSNRGLDFAVVAGAMAGCRLPVPEIGWGTEGVALGEHGLLEWAVLDAQWFGLAQRRRRVFALLDAGDWASRPPILLEPDKLRGDSPPRRKAGQVAPTIPARSTAGGGLGTDFDCDGGTICVATGQAGAEIGADMAPTLNCNHEAPYVAHSLRGEGFDASEDGTGRGTPWVPVAMINMQGSKGNAVAQADGPSFTLNAMHGHDMHAVAVPMVATTERIRRITPLEAERLMGFPDNYTAIPWRKKPAYQCPDGPRYKALGNSWAVPNVRWIGERIARQINSSTTSPPPAGFFKTTP